MVDSHGNTEAAVKVPISGRFKIGKVGTATLQDNATFKTGAAPSGTGWLDTGLNTEDGSYQFNFSQPEIIKLWQKGYSVVGEGDNKTVTGTFAELQDVVLGLLAADTPDSDGLSIIKESNQQKYYGWWQILFSDGSVLTRDGVGSIFVEEAQFTRGTPHGRPWTFTADYRTEWGGIFRQLYLEELSA